MTSAETVAFEQRPFARSWEAAVPVKQHWIVAESDTLKEEVDALKRLQAEAAAELDALLPALLDRAWTHSLPAHSGFALPLRKIPFAHSQCAQIKGEL